MDITALYDECKACTACHLRKGATQVVPWQYAEKPEVVFIGEAPGATEDRVGLPFQGAAGRMLDRILKALGMARGSDAWITNIVKCRPPQNRTPTDSEREFCAKHWLIPELLQLEPKVVICLGLTSGQFLLNQPDARMADLHGKTATTTISDGAGNTKQILVGVTYHPAYIVYNGESPRVKQLIWHDLISILRAAGLWESGNSDERLAHHDRR